MKVKNIYNRPKPKPFFLLLLIVYFFNFQAFGQSVLSEKTLKYLSESTDDAFLERIHLTYDSVSRLGDVSDRTAISEQLFGLTEKRGGTAHMHSLLFRKMNTRYSEESGLFAKAYKLAEKSGDFDAMCLVEYSRARYFNDRKQYDSAMVYLLHYRDMTPEDMKGEGYRNIVNLMGDIYYQAGLYDKATEVYELLYNEYVKENNWSFYRPYVMMNNLGQIALKTRDPERAGFWFRLSLQRAKAHLNTSYQENILAYTSLKLLETALQTGDVVQAEAFLRQYEAFPEDHLTNDVRLEYLWQSANLLFRQQKYGEALKKVNILKKEAEISGMLQRFVPDIYELLSEICRVQQNYEKAIYYNDLFIEKMDSIRSNEYLAQSMIILSDHNHTITKMELQKTKTQSKYLFWGLLILMVLFLFLLWVSFNLHRSKLALVRKSVVQSIEDEANKKLEQAFSDEGGESKTDNEDRDKELFRQLKKIMETEKLYLDPKLNILSLAEQLATNRTYLSQAINSQYHMTFPNFINEYRINEAVRLITTGYTDDYTQEALAAKVGFSSRGTFIAAFKKVTGVVPSFFIANHKKMEGMSE